MSGKCPTCRDAVTPVRMNCFGVLSPSERIHTKNKSEVCLDWIRMNPSGRFVIYSAFDNVFYQLFEEIDRMGRKAERVESNHFALVKTVRNFKQGATQILFVSNPELLRGLSFPFVTHLIFYHDLSSYERKQLLIQSAHRLGRTQPLRVIHLHSEVQV
jgi:late competence protein required for DNA uptake (superfamily II DNA/RNA helicase)